jgi:hypothetical protein
VKVPKLIILVVADITRIGCENVKSTAVDYTVMILPIVTVLIGRFFFIAYVYPFHFLAWHSIQSGKIGTNPHPFTAPSV